MVPTTHHIHITLSFSNIYYPLEPPSEPREPGIVDFDNKSVTLRWNKPTDSGGRPITHFIIQKKDKFGGWFDALITDDDNCMATIDELEARVPGLSEGDWRRSLEYEIFCCAGKVVSVQDRGS